MNGVVSHCMVQEAPTLARSHSEVLHIKCIDQCWRLLFKLGETTVSVLLIGNADAILCRRRDLEHLP